MRKFFTYFDLPLFFALVLLSVIGITALYSVSLNSTEAYKIISRQIFFSAAGWTAFLFFAFFNYHSAAKLNRTAFALLVVTLIIILFLSPEIRGGRRWLDLGFFSIQPAEFIKISLILAISRALYLRRGAINSIKNIFFTLLLAIVPFILILLQPDLGSGLVILLVWGGMLLAAPVNKKILSILVISALAAIAISWFFLLKDFQKSRIEIFLSPNSDLRGSGYNVRQAVIAVGSGQIFGKGLGQGVQSQNKFLPEKQTDFIFAAIAEEIGFVGCLVWIGIYIFILGRVLKISHLARDDLGSYIAIGVFCLFFVHLFINLGMNMGIMPVTGIPLPFASAGGSSLVLFYSALGIVQNIHRHNLGSSQI